MTLRATLSDPTLIRAEPEAPALAIDVRNPATGAIIGTVPDEGTAETEAAIAAAVAAAQRARAGGPAEGLAPRHPGQRR